MLGDELCHDDAGERHDRSARKIDPGGQNDQRLPDGDDADDHHLLEYQRKVLAREEAVAAGREENAGDDESHERTERGGAREMLHLRWRGAVECALITPTEALGHASLDIAARDGRD